MNPIKRILYGLIKKNRHLQQEFYAKIHYEYFHEKKLNLDKPVEFSEKIHWLKVYYHLPILNQLVDKFAVRSFVKEKIGEQYLNEIYAVYNNVSEVNYEELPDQFVVKATHTSNANLIVKDKSKLNKIKARFLMTKWMRENLYYSGGQEWAYKDIQPRIIAEKYLNPADGSLKDFRFFCFSGEPKFVQIGSVYEDARYVSYYNLNWEKMPVIGVSPEHPVLLEKPHQFDEMVRLATTLSQTFPFVRVDMYPLVDRIVFGEMTFYPNDGRASYIPSNYNKVFGDYIKLPKIPEGQKEIIAI
jgi:hypothetical protein